MTADAARASTIDTGYFALDSCERPWIIPKSGRSMMLFPQLLRESRSQSRRILPLSRFALFRPVKLNFIGTLAPSVDGADSSA
jgi:hypothetical protein